MKPQGILGGIYNKRYHSDQCPVYHSEISERNEYQMKIFALDPLDLPIFYNLLPESLLHDVPAGALLVGCADGDPLQPAGVLIAHVELRSLIVDWLYVDEAYRRRGGAGQMMQMLLDCAFAVEEIEDVTLTFSQKHKGMDAFLRAMQFGVLFMEGCKGYETTLGMFRFLPGEKAIPGKVVPLHTVAQQEIDRFDRLLASGIVPDVGIRSLRPEDYRPESMAYLEGNTMLGLWLVQQRDGKLFIPWFCNFSKALTVPISLMNASVRAMNSSYRPDTPVYFASLSPKMESVIRKLFQTPDQTEIYFASYLFERN